MTAFDGRSPVIKGYRSRAVGSLSEPVRSFTARFPTGFSKAEFEGIREGRKGTGLEMETCLFGRFHSIPSRSTSTETASTPGRATSAVSFESPPFSCPFFSGGKFLARSMQMPANANGSKEFRPETVLNRARLPPTNLSSI